MTKPLILISNDDGVTSKGIHTLIDIVADMADIYVSAPMEQHSGQSSAISVSKMLRIHKFDDYKGAKIFGVNGTPVDCVKLALHTILPRRPDFMLSGINHGSNAGNCAIYSGTMGAAFETCMAGIPSVAFSLLSHNPDADFDGCHSFIRKICEKTFACGLPQDVCLNVNIPAKCIPEGIKVVRAARGCWSDEYEEYLDPMKQKFYLLTGRFQNMEPDADDTDEYWLKRNYISVVPCTPDQSNLSAISTIKEMLG